jgi:hypothetical protein
MEADIEIDAYFFSSPKGISHGNSYKQPDTYVNNSILNFNISNVSTK